MQLTKHFSLAELTRSDTAAKRGIYNIPEPEHVENLKALCVNVLEPVRVHFDRPVTIKSGFRCYELNRMIGGAANSQHTTGQAADIEIRGVDNADVFRFIAQNLTFDQLIAEMLEHDDGEAGWIHVSYAPTNRKQQLSFLGKGRGYHVGLQFM
jgi:hypothetical protein